MVTWLLCANAAGRCHERLGGTSGNPCATATAIAALCIVRGYAYSGPFYVFTEVVLVRLCRTPSPQGQCQEEGYQSYQGSETQTLTGHHVMVTYDN